MYIITHSFTCLQLRHTFQMQFGLGGCNIQVPRFELLLKGDPLENLYLKSINCFFFFMRHIH